MRRVYDRGLTTATGGNISILDEHGDIWITPKAVDKGSLTQKDIVCVHPDGSYDGIHAPSSEIFFHRATYRAILLQNARPRQLLQLWANCVTICTQYPPCGRAYRGSKRPLLLWA